MTCEAKTVSLIIIAMALMGMAVCIGLLIGSNAARADTLVCEINKHTENRLVIYSTTNPGIKRMSAGVEFSFVNYKNGKYVQLNSETFTCHHIKGDGDKNELERVNELIALLTGGDLE